MTSAQFVHLHVHSEFSLEDSTVRLKPLVSEVVNRDMGAVALTDLSNMFAAVKIYKSATANGVKPVLGADVWVYQADAPFTLSRLVLLCRDDGGYLNLKRLLSRAYQEGVQADRPTIDIAWLKDCSAGLFALSAGLDGDIGMAFQAGNLVQADACLERWLSLFPGHFFLEIQRVGKQHEEAFIQQCLHWSSRLGVPLVATNDVRFIDETDFDAHEVRVCICNGYTLEDQRRPKIYTAQQYLRTAGEMVELFSDIPEAIENTVRIATACNLRLQLGTAYLPEYPIPQGHTTDSYFRLVSEQGLDARLDFLKRQLKEGQALDETIYRERLKVELDVIIEMGFPGYFLIVMDFIDWAKRNGIPVGPGRGSGAGSLVAYALKITDLDPLAYDLLFERFLNPERVSMPDFDVDFCMDRRDEVIEYVADHYGRDQVSQIITYGTMAAKAVIRDVGRVLSHPYGFVDSIAKLVPFEIGMTLDKALEQEDELRQRYQDEEEVTALIDMARSLEGLTRNVGKHAGGVVISPSALTDFTPTYCESGGGGLVSQFDKNDVEEVGLVKFDFLGLRTLTIIDWAVKAINQRRPEGNLQIESIPLDDPATFELLQQSQTTAVFQLESNGMKELIRKLQPDNFEDIIALVALFRPGPLQSGMVDDFIDRKHGRKKVEYPHPDLEPILKPTYGVILYQEQVMQIAQVLAGYTLGGADMLRRAMGKKKPEEMEKQRSIFTGGAVANHVNADTATYIFDLMEKFAGYGFNKSHSAAYALVSYQTAWLKRHYPAEFMAAVLSADMDNTDKVVTLINECREMGLPIKPPDINYSQYRFTASAEGVVYYGLGAIKGVGESAIDNILASRQGNNYLSLDDFCSRIDGGKVNKRVIEALIKAGALDTLHDNRAALVEHLPTAMQSAEQQRQNQNAGMTDMFGDIIETGSSLELPACDPWDDHLQLMLEKDALGLFLTGHPLQSVAGEVEQISPAPLAHWLQRLEPASGNGGGNGFRRKGQKTIVCGLVVDIRMRNGFRGREAFVTLDDRSGRIDIRVSPDLLSEYEQIVLRDVIWVVEGEISYDDFNNGIRMRASSIQLLEDYRQSHSRALHITLNGETAEQQNALFDDLSRFHCEDATPLVFHLRHDHYSFQLKSAGRWSLQASDECMRTLRRHLSVDQLRFEY